MKWVECSHLLDRSSSGKGVGCWVFRVHRAAKQPEVRLCHLELTIRIPIRQEVPRRSEATVRSMNLTPPKDAQQQGPKNIEIEHGEKKKSFALLR